MIDSPTGRLVKHPRVQDTEEKKPLIKYNLEFMDFSGVEKRLLSWVLGDTILGGKRK